MRAKGCSQFECILNNDKRCSQLSLASIEDKQYDEESEQHYARAVEALDWSDHIITTASCSARRPVDDRAVSQRLKLIPLHCQSSAIECKLQRAVGGDLPPCPHRQTTVFRTSKGS